MGIDEALKLQSIGVKVRRHHVKPGAQPRLIVQEAHTKEDGAFAIDSRILYPVANACVCELDPSTWVEMVPTAPEKRWPVLNRQRQQSDLNVIGAVERPIVLGTVCPDRKSL